MPIQVLMPALSPTMTEGTIAGWVKNEGDSVAPGDVIAEIETDKATMEVEAVDEGVLGKILVAAGTDNVAVNTPIALLLTEGEDASALEGAVVAAPAPAPASAPEEAAPAPVEAAAAPAPAASAAPSGAPSIIEVPLMPNVPELVPPPAFDEDEKFHQTVKCTVREALRDAMALEMRSDDKVFVMGEEVAEYQGAYKVTQGLLAEFGPKRVIDTPITEHGFAGVGVGAAMYGLKPVVEFMTFNFAMQAIDQIINSAAKTLYMSGGQMGAPMVFRGPNGAASRVAAQHSQDYSAWYGAIPGLKVVAPYTAADAKGLLRAAIQDPNPVIFLENEILYGHSFDVPEDDDFVVPIGKAKIVREGTDVTIVGYSICVAKALQAAETLAEQGISAEVIDLRTIRPMDKWTVIQSLKKTNRLVTVEENWPFAGIGAELAATAMDYAFDYLDAPVARVSQKDVPLPYAANLEVLALPQAEDVVTAAKAVCNRA